LNGLELMKMLVKILERGKQCHTVKNAHLVESSCLVSAAAQRMVVLLEHY
jgi:hypothetical protein